MRFFETLTGKLIGRQIILLTVLLVVIGFSLYVILRTVLFSASAHSLHDEIAVLAPIVHHTLKQRSPKDFALLAQILTARLHNPGVEVLVTNAMGHIIASSSTLLQQTPPLYAGDYFLWHGHVVVDAPLGNPLFPSGYIWLMTAVAPMQRILHRVVELYAFLALAVLLLSGWLGALSVRQSLYPLRQIRDSTVKIASGEFGHTTAIGRAPRELADLGEAIDSMSLAIKDLFEQEKALSEQMRRFVADASHELRTPLTAIIGFLDLMARGELNPDEERRGVAVVRKQGQRMAQLVNQLLTLSRVESAPESQVQLAPLDLPRWLQETLPAGESLLGDRPLVIQAGPAVVRADPDRMTEILLNLLDNVSRYTPAGTVVELTTGTNENQGFLTVADHGPGIPQDDLPHIFERFYRSDRSRSSTSGGSGLGLAIVKALARAQGGTVIAANRQPPQHGAVFTVFLPLALR